VRRSFLALDFGNISGEGRTESASRVTG